MTDIVMPRLSDSMEEGTVLTWLKQVGEQVAVGEELVEIETDKANMAYESDVAGTLTEILAAEGETLPIGAPIARVGDPAEGSNRPAAGPDAGEGPAGEHAGSSSAPPPRHPQSKEGETTAGAPAAQASPSPEPGEAGAGERLKASPVARRIAKEQGLDLAAIEGSGPGGRIVKSDVRRAAAAAAEAGASHGVAGGQPPSSEGDGAAAGPAAGAPPPAPATPLGTEPPESAKGQVAYEEPSKLQATVARRMAESKATAPHFYLEAEIDMSAAVRARARLKAALAEGEPAPSFNDMVIKACALALREFPRANGAYRDGRFELYSRVNVGFAVAAPGALVVPTVFDADRKGLGQIAADSRALAQRVREGQITPPELSGATFTVSNLGMYGVDSFAAVINSPQAGILAVGAIRERPAVRAGEIVAAQLMSATLACDHRILYGAEGAQFLARVRTLLEEPLFLAL